jgi:DNA-nicking Smr family endonuclease
MDRPFRVLGDWMREGRLRLARNDVPREPLDAVPPEILDRADELSSSELFQAATEGVRRRRWNDASVRAEPVAGRDSDGEAEALRALRELCRSGQVEVHQTREYVEHSVQPVGRLYLEDLREGRFAVQAHLDLHGLSIAQARERVDAFVHASVRAGYTCVRIVHGRGRHSVGSLPLMKKSVERWLRQRRLARWVIAYTSARRVDGGGGAVYVLLRGDSRSGSGG